MKKETMILKVAGSSQTPSLAGSIVKSIEDGKKVELHAIGASANNQTVKAIASARGILATKGYDVSFKVGFGETKIEGLDKTVMIYKLIVE